MPVPVTLSGPFRMTFVCATRNSGAAVGLLASHLGLDRRDIAQRMAQGPSVLAEAVPAGPACHLVPILSALGVTVQIDPAGSPAPVFRVEVAIQPLQEPAAAVIARIARRLRLPPETLRAGLAEPTGLILSRTLHEAETLRRRLCHEREVRVAVSNPAGARYDLFLKAGRVASADLILMLRRLGLAPCPFSGAVAAALDAGTAALMVARHGSCVHALNRDFQRFDLILAGSRGMTQAELVDFLATRTLRGREILRAPQVAEGVRLESDLSRRAAQQFRADYAQIGLETRMELVLPAAAQVL